MKHPDKLNNFAVWMDGDKLLGVVDVTLPNLTPLKETSKGAEIAYGEPVGSCHVVHYLIEFFEIVVMENQVCGESALQALVDPH